jgi:cell division protein FtsQ
MTGPAMTGQLPGERLAGERPSARVPSRPRRGSRRRAVVFALAGLAIVTGVGWALLGDQVFVVRSISVTGAHLVTPAEVIAAADVPPGTPLLRVDNGAVTRRVEGIAQVASATVSEDWPDHLAITVTERVPVLAVRMAAGGYAQVDPAGVVVRMSTARPATLPLLVTGLSGAALRGDPAVAAAAGVLTELAPSLRRSVASVTTTTIVTAGNGAGAARVTLRLRDGVALVWGDSGNASAKNREAATLLLGHVHYVDVSSPGTAVTR